MVSPGNNRSPEIRNYDDMARYDDKGTSQKRYCGGKLKKNQCIGVTVASVLVVLLVIILLAIFVGGKKIAQSGVDSSQVGVKSMTLGSPVGVDKGIQVKMEVSISNGSPLDSTISSFVMGMEYQGKVFAEIPYPEMALKASSMANFVVEGVLSVADMKVFNQYSQDLLSKDNITVTTQASVTAKAMGLSFSGLDLTKTLTLPGVSGFNNPPPKVISQNVLSADANSLTLGMLVEMYNPSTFVFSDTGRLTMSIQYEGTDIGFAVTNDESVKIPMGKFEMNMTASIVRTDSNQEKVIDLLSKFTSGEDITMILRGENTTISLLSKSVKSLETVTVINGLKTLSTERVAPFRALEKTLYEIVNPLNIASSLESRDIHARPDMIQAVFCPMPATAIQGVSLIGPSGHPTVTAYQVIYNPLNATVNMHRINVSVFFHKDTSGRYPLPDRMPDDFILATAVGQADEGKSLITLQPMQTALMPQDLEIATSSLSNVMLFYSWIYEAFKINNKTGLLDGTTHDDCKTRDLSAPLCGGSFSTAMRLKGEVELTIGDGFRTSVRINQIIRNDATLYDTGVIDFKTMKYKKATA